MTARADQVYLQTNLSSCSASLSMKSDSCDPCQKPGIISLNWQLLMMILICKESFSISGEYLILHNHVEYSPSRIMNCLG